MNKRDAKIKAYMYAYAILSSAADSIGDGSLTVEEDVDKEKVKKEIEWIAQGLLSRGERMVFCTRN